MSCNRNRSNNNDVLGDSGRRRCNGDVAGDRGECRCRCECDRVSPAIAIRGPGCISGTGRCGEFTASFVETNGRPAEGYCGQVSPAGNMFRNKFNDDDVAGDFGRRHCEDVEGDFGDRKRCNGDVAGDSGRRPWQNVRGRCGDVAGDRGRRHCDDDVAGDRGRRRCEDDDVAGDRGRRHHDCDCFERCLIEFLEDVLAEFEENDNHCCPR
ncbi:MAG: hypothetical protein K0Q97_2680 [Bacillota bacterium]|nr:hypothetical protein [Bacillota bacterium]